MINIQVHGVLAVKWGERKDAFAPRILQVTTKEGYYEFALFPERSVATGPQPEGDDYKPRRA